MGYSCCTCCTDFQGITSGQPVNPGPAAGSLVRVKKAPLGPLPKAPRQAARWGTWMCLSVRISEAPCQGFSNSQARAGRCWQTKTGVVALLRSQNAKEIQGEQECDRSLSRTVVIPCKEIAHVQLLCSAARRLEEGLRCVNVLAISLAVLGDEVTVVCATHVSGSNHGRLQALTPGLAETSFAS